MHEIKPLILNSIIIVICILSSVIDVKTKKIPNVLTFGGAIVGIIINTVNHGASGFFLSVLAYIIAVLIMVALDPKHKVGYGDVKLMACIGAFIGPKLILITWFFYALIFGSFAIIRIAGALPWLKLMGDFIVANQTKQPFVLNFDKTKLNMVLKSRVSLAPFIALSLIFTLVFGETILQAMFNNAG